MLYIDVYMHLCYNDIVEEYRLLGLSPRHIEKEVIILAISEAQKRATMKYMKNNYDRLEIKVLKGSKQAIQDVAASVGESINGYVKKAVRTQIKADTGNDIEL